MVIPFDCQRSNMLDEAGGDESETAILPLDTENIPLGKMLHRLSEELLAD